MEVIPAGSLLQFKTGELVLLAKDCEVYYRFHNSPVNGYIYLLDSAGHLKSNPDIYCLPNCNEFDIVSGV
jgi:hypothetical protein